jgi:hypothetical protein
MLSVYSLQVSGELLGVDGPPKGLGETWKQVLGVPGRPIRVIAIGLVERLVMGRACFAE